MPPWQKEEKRNMGWGGISVRKWLLRRGSFVKLGHWCLTLFKKKTLPSHGMGMWGPCTGRILGEVVNSNETLRVGGLFEESWVSYFVVLCFYPPVHFLTSLSGLFLTKIWPENNSYLEKYYSSEFEISPQYIMLEGALHKNSNCTLKKKFQVNSRLDQKSD